MDMIFFDIDNTLVDYNKSETEAIHFIITKYGLKLALYEKSWKNISKKYFAKYLEQEISFHEQGAQRIKKFFELGEKKITLQEAERVFFEYKEVLEKNWVLFDDVLPCLKKISTVEKGIASNGQVAQQNNKLEKTGIAACFSMKKYASEMNCAKPDYRFFELLKRYCGDENYIYVGDDLQTDIYPCMNLGIKTIWINRMGEEVPEGVNAIQSLKELEIEDKE